MFALTGFWQGHYAELKYVPEQGDFEGNAVGLTALDAREASARPLLQTPTGPEYEPARTPAHVAYLLAFDALDDVSTFSGTAPEFPDDDSPPDTVF